MFFQQPNGLRSAAEIFYWDCEFKIFLRQIFDGVRHRSAVVVQPEMVEHDIESANKNKIYHPKVGVVRRKTVAEIRREIQLSIDEAWLKYFPDERKSGVEKFIVTLVKEVRKEISNLPN